MKKLIVTLALAATVVSSLTATRPARAAGPDAFQLQPQLVQPDLGGLQVKPVVPLSPQILLFKRAELTSQLFVLYGYHPLYNPSPNPNYPAILCLVRNTGLAGSGWFKTLIRIDRTGIPVPIQVYVPMNIPAGGWTLVHGHVYAPFGLKRVFSFADATFLVPEYNEANNWDSIP